MDAILFLHHLPLDSGITQRHYMLLKVLNPDCALVALSFYDGRSRPCPIPAEQWKNPDKLVLQWFTETKPQYGRYFIMEYDVFCTQSLREFYGPAINRPVVGAVVVKPWSDEIIPGQTGTMRGWHWFSHVESRIGEFACGIVPLCGTMLSHAALSAMVEIYQKDELFDRLQCECRMGTLARAAGYEPERIRDDAHDFILPSAVTIRRSRGIFHSVKN